MSKPKVLLSGLGGSLFPYLHQKLKDKYELYYVDSDASLKELYPDFNFYPAPLVVDDKYAAFIIGLIRRNAIDLYAPLIDEEIEVAHRIKDECGSLNLLSPELSFCRMAMRKNLLMERLEFHGISSISTWTGDTFKFIDGKNYFVKPISGRGSRGIREIRSVRELEAYYILEKSDPRDVLIQECIEGVEYTVGALINHLSDVIALSSRRILKKRGITIRAVTENNAAIEKVVMELNRHLQPRGPINVQLYITKDGEIKIFEINPRFSTTTIMSYEGGVDEIGLWMKFSDTKYGGEIIRPKENILLHRRWENVFYANR